MKCLERLAQYFVFIDSLRRSAQPNSHMFLTVHTNTCFMLIYSDQLHRSSDVSKVRDRLKRIKNKYICCKNPKSHQRQEVPQYSMDMTGQ